MAYRSWLKDVRKINDLGRHLFHFPKGKEDWDRLDEYDRKGSELYLGPIPVEPGSEKFFGCKSILSYVIETKRLGDRFEVHLFDREAHGFVWEYGAVTGIEVEDCKARVTLVFEGVNYANSVRPDAEGWLKHADISSWLATDNLLSTDRILHDWFYEQDGSIQWIGEFMKSESSRSWPQNHVYILVDCKRVYARDDRAIGIRSVAGDECLRIWNEFDELVRSDKSHWINRNQFISERVGS